jgi:hypothetical protein
MALTVNEDRISEAARRLGAVLADLRTRPVAALA